MASEPRHPMMKTIIGLITKNLLELKQLNRVMLVFVTGPHVVKEGWERFIAMGPTNYTHLLQNNFEYTGGHNKTVLKAEPKNLVISKDGYNDVVSLYNSTTTVTRKQRIEIESGIDHWKTIMFKKGQTKQGKDNSCRAYLEELDNEKSGG